MPLVVAPKYSGIINREFEGWEVYEHGGRTLGVYQTKAQAKQKAREARDENYDDDLQIKVVSKSGGVKWL